MDQIQSLIRDYLLGFRMGLRHSSSSFKLWIDHVESTFSLDAHLSDKSDEDEESNNAKYGDLKLVGVGFGRTGTYSLKLALEELGYSTLHTNHMYEYPLILDMWSEHVFEPAIVNRELLLGNPDFDVVTSHGFQAVVDLPTALYYEKLIEKYPDCKFILTTREDSEAWFRSFKTMIVRSTESMRLPGSHSLKHVSQLSVYLRWLNAMVSQNIDYLGAPIWNSVPPPDKKEAIATYENHNRAVRDRIPTEKLLEYNIKDGWAPLCEFLDISECPSSPFPKSNSLASLRAMTNTPTILLYSITMLLILILIKSLRKYTQKITFCRYPPRRILAKKIF